MVNAPTPNQASYLSTGVVSRALGLDQAAVRAMIKSGSLPEPQWMTLGNTVERIYSLEWLVLASERVNGLRLSGLEFEISPENTVQFALRFNRNQWSLGDVARKLAAVESLWTLCARVMSTDEAVPTPELHIRRLSAGSPLDLLAWVDQDWQGLLGAGGLVGLFLYVLKNPDKVAGAIPRAVAAWREEWALADEAAIHRALARIDRKRFKIEANRLLSDLGDVPSDTALSGRGTSRLELVATDDVSGALEILEPPTEFPLGINNDLDSNGARVPPIGESPQ